MAGAALSQGDVQISWHSQQFRKVRCRFRGMRSGFARSRTYFVAGAACLQGQVERESEREIEIEIEID